MWSCLRCRQDRVLHRIFVKGTRRAPPRLHPFVAIQIGVLGFLFVTGGRMVLGA